MPPSRLDSIYRRLLITRFFEKGWGKPENLQRLFEFRKIISRRETCFNLIPTDYPVDIVSESKYPDFTVIEGKFMTPLELHLPGVVPKAAQTAHFQVLLPNKWKDDKFKPVCIHFAGTGDHYFWRRRNFIAKPLLREGNIGAIILENPFYGLRKPDNQVRSNLQNVSDIFVMGGCLMLECLVLLHWCEKNNLGPMGVTGLSMGGHMASLAATNWPKPLAVVPCLSWSTASSVFTTGVMSQSINWDTLETQYYSDGQYCEQLSKMVSVIDDAFTAGQKFIKEFKQSLRELEEDIKDARHKHTNVELKYEADGLKKVPDTEGSNMQQRLISEQNSKLKGEHKPFIPSSPPLTSTCRRGTASEATECKDESALTKLMKYIMPQAVHSANDKIDISKINWWEREALQFMRGVMDECTHLKNFSVPYDTSLIIAVCARDDGYVPREGCTSLEDIWPGVDVRYLDAGHVSAYVLHQKLFRSCIIEVFERAKKVYEKDGDKWENIRPTLTYQELLKKYAKTV